MLEAAEEIKTFTSMKKREDLDQDRKLSLSIIRLLEIIGEAAKKVSDEIRSKYTEVPWEAIIGTRNRLIHAYFDVDLDIVWETVQRDIPSLISYLVKIIEQEKEL
jgi:uncharacterized protein with HEPN domain